jgi:hypothetical protein
MVAENMFKGKRGEKWTLLPIGYLDHTSIKTYSHMTPIATRSSIHPDPCNQKNSLKKTFI